MMFGTILLKINDNLFQKTSMQKENLFEIKLNPQIMIVNNEKRDELTK